MVSYTKGYCQNMIFFLLSTASVSALPPPGQYYASNAPVNEYIVNGNDVEKGRWPWMLSLEVLDPEFRHTCGASLIGMVIGQTL